MRGNRVAREPDEIAAQPLVIASGVSPGSSGACLKAPIWLRLGNDLALLCDLDMTDGHFVDIMLSWLPIRSRLVRP